MTDQDRHSHQLDSRNLVIKFFGVLRGIKYGAIIDLKDGHAKWDDTIEYVKPILTTETTADTDSSNCPGCKNNLMKLVKGGFGWAKEVLGVGQVPTTVGQARKGTCLNCPSNCYDFGVCRDDWDDGRLPEQQGCGCILALKVTQASEECPHKHWLKHNG